MAAEVIIEEQPKKGQDKLDVKDPDGHTGREYLDVLESFGGEFHKAFAQRVQKQLDNFLIKYGDPNQYGQYGFMVDTLWESMLAWAVVNEWVKLRKKALPTEEEQEKLRKAKEEYAEKNGGDSPPGGLNITPSGYL